MSDDITRILKAWKYEPGELRVRKVTSEDGRDLIQIRMDLGIMQLEWSGRPDGAILHDQPSLLDHYRAEHRRHRASGNSEPFVLGREDCWALGQEAMQYYWRRISFFELKQYELAEQDAEHNLGILDLCGEFGEHEEDRQMREQYRVFVTAHRIQARALKHLDQEDHAAALAVIRNGIAEVEGLLKSLGGPDAVETCTELTFLRDWEQEVEESRPRSQSEQLQVDLEAAVEEEKFELAASLRDRLREIETGRAGGPR